ncbi:MAG TPA: Na+/H+ antiporter [Ktedonobacteraceae bacterium]|nr:Na+/H+ antiporter [Ktedonobacteraceae bacterium]
MPTTITLVFGLLVAIVILATVATRFHLPYAIVLVLGGLILGFVPGLPTIELDPQLLLFLFLPPLIYSSAWFTSWREFRANVRPIFLLSIGLVLATTALVAVVAHVLIGLSWPVAFVLGAIVSPTDAVAASATAQSAGLSRRLVTVIEGESMVNDATGLVVYRFAVAVVVSGSFSFAQASFQFALVSLGGLLIGLLVSWPLAWFHRVMDNAPIEIALTLLTPFAAYLLAEALDVSGVLAVMAAGLSLSRQSARFFSANTRLQANAVWNVLVFLFNGFVFLLIGLQLHHVLEAVTSRDPLVLLWEALLVCLTVMLVRLLWVLPAAFPTRLFGLLGRYLGERSTQTSWRNVLILSWTGMRGGVSLAAALALPLTLAGGKAFPERDLVLFLTFCVILATLVGQGLSLGPLIRLLRLPEDGTHEREHAQAHLTAARAALVRLDELEGEVWTTEEDLAHLRSVYENKIQVYLARVDGNAETGNAVNARPEQTRRLRQEILQAERTSVIRLRDQKYIDDEVLRVVERELDLEEQRLLTDW